MRVVHVAFADDNGAGRGAVALHEALVHRGVDSHLVVSRTGAKESGPSAGRRVARFLSRNGLRAFDQGILLAYPGRRREIFSTNLLPTPTLRRVTALEPDVVHLHWVGAGYLRVEDVPRFSVPVVWTLRDMWPFTGGCHYSAGCDRFQQSCGSCPALGSTRDRDLSRSGWERRRGAYGAASVTPVAISSWMRDMAAASSLFGSSEIELVHNAVDTEAWTPGDPHAAREALDLPRDRSLVLFVALNPLSDRRKGFDTFVAACRELSRRPDGDAITAVVVGDDRTAAIDLGVPAVHLGEVGDDRLLRDVYRAVDVTVLTSTEEAFGKTGAESLACGTPIVVHDSTGLVDLVQEGETGFVSPFGDPIGIADAIVRCLRTGNPRAMAEAARRDAENRFSAAAQADRYVVIYERLEREG